MVAAAVTEAAKEAVPRGFRQTEIGLIPEDWEVVALGEVLAGYRLGGNYPNTETSAGPPLIKMGNLGRGDIVLDKIEYIPSFVRLDDRDRLRFGDLLFNTRNTLDLVGKIAMWRDELPLAYFNSNILRFHFDAKRISSSAFMNYVLNSPDAIEFLRGIAIGTTSVAAIYWRDLRNLRFPLPPLAEQEAIAGALSDADGAIRAVERALAKQRAVKHAALHALLRPTTRLPGFSGAWETKTFGQLAKPRRERINPQTGQHSDFCVELDNIGQGSGQLLGWTETTPDASLKTVFQNGDVLFGKLRSYLRKYWFADRAGVCSTEIWALEPTPQSAVGEFVFQIVQQDHFIDASSMAYGTHMPRSDWNIVAAIEISLPPLPEQSAIAAVLSDMDAAIAALEARRDKLKAVKQGMMQTLLTGKVRLV